MKNVERGQAGSELNPRLNRLRLEAMVKIPVKHIVVFEQGHSPAPYSFIRPANGHGVAVVIRNANPYDPDDQISIESVIGDINRRYRTQEEVRQGLAEYKMDTVFPTPVFPEYKPQEQLK